MTEFESVVLDGFLTELYNKVKQEQPEIGYHWTCFCVIEQLVNKHPGMLGQTNYDMGHSRQSIKDRLDRLWILRKI